MSNALDTQVDGSHYKDMAIQPAEFNHANGLPFIEGSVVKYVSRHRSKNGARDVRKAIHFLQLLLHLEYGESMDEAKPDLPPAPEIDNEDPYGVCETPPESRWLCRNAVSELAERALEQARHKPVTGYWHQCRCGNGFESASEFAHCRHCNGETTGRVRRG